MQTLRWSVVLPLCVSCGYAFMFSSLRDKAREAPGTAPCGGHFRIRQHLPEHAHGWLGSKWLWLLLILAVYAILKFRGERAKKKEQNPIALRSCQFRGSSKKSQNASTSKDCAFNTLTQLEMELVKFVSKVRSLKVSMAASSGNLRLQVPEMPGDSHNNITIYEIWGEES